MFKGWEGTQGVGELHPLRGEGKGEGIVRQGLGQGEAGTRM